MQSRLNQIVDESSSVGKALTEWYAQHNIQIYDQQGQLMSLYDILSQVAKIWSTLTTNEKDYYLNQQAGANQTTQLSAILSNFENVLKATDTAYESLGSAARENAAYMESLEAKTNSLKAEFQDLATNVLDKELIAGFLDMGNGLLKLADAIPPIVVQVGLLAGVLGPLGALLSKFYLGPVLGISANLAPIGAALAVVVPLALKLFSAWKDAHPTFEEATNQIQSLNDELERNQTRLEEINKIPWYERTTEINQEKAALELENEELRDQIEYYKQLRGEKARKTAGAAQDVYTGQVSEYRVYSKQAETGVGAFTSFANLEDAQAYAEAMGEGFGHIEEVMEVVTLKGDELDKNLTENLTHINDAMIANGEVSEDLSDWWQHNGDVVKEQYQAYKVLEAATQEQQALIKQYELFVNIGAEATEQTKFLAENILDSQGAVNKLAKQYPELSSAISENNGQLGINISKLDGIQYSSLEAKQAIYDLAIQMIKANANQLDMSSSIAQLQQVALSAGVAGAALNFTEWVDEYEDQTVAWEKYVTYTTKKVQQALKDTWEPASTGLGNMAKATDKATASTKKLTDALKAQKQALQDEINTLKDQSSIYETLFTYLQNQIDKEISALEDEKSVLQAQNEELETQIELEEKLDELSRAKAKKTLVYKGGRFQYVSDIDEVASAQADLQAYYVKREYQAQLDELDAQIEALQAQKEAIQVGQQQVQEEINLQKVTEQLGIDLTGSWRGIYKNLEVYLQQYQKLLASISLGEEELELLPEQIGQIGGTTLTGDVRLPSSAGGGTAQVGDIVVTGGGVYLKTEGQSVKIGELDTPTGTTTSAEELKRLYESGGWHLYDSYSSGGGGSSAKPASTEKDSKGRPVSGVGSNQYNYLTNLAKTGTAGEKEWAKQELAAGRYARGTVGAVGGMSLVGEHGAELRVLNKGDGILPADVTKNLWAWGSITPASLFSSLGFGDKGTSVVIQNVSLPNVQDANDFARAIQTGFWRTAVQGA